MTGMQTDRKIGEETQTEKVRHTEEERDRERQAE